MKKVLPIENEWAKELSPFFETKAFGLLTDFIRDEYHAKKIFPELQNIFRVFTLTPFSKVKVVIIGQDPYHGDGQAHGLSFSVEDGTVVPPSLKNIYKEIQTDIGIVKDFSNGNLECWASQGVFLLNSILTVVAHAPASHKGKGWEVFTDMVIKIISDKHEHVVFMLWGKYACSKRVLIDSSKHLVLEASHPSPFSSHTGFFGSKHFSKCNTYLEKHGKEPISW